KKEAQIAAAESLRTQILQELAGFLN
ncbi:MAG: hypothetical protein PWR27_2251, partial [Petroclostridium sp.]|nr:hypothetical protein [Petroclostridium sp.]